MIRAESSARRAGRRSAFTLMEVLVVVAILVVLAGIGVPIYLSYLDDAKATSAKVQAKGIGEACVRYEVKYGSKPESLQLLTAPPDGAAPYYAPADLVDPWQQPYQYDPSGQHNSQAGKYGKPDVYTTNPKTSEVIGNW